MSHDIRHSPRQWRGRSHRGPSMWVGAACVAACAALATAPVEAAEKPAAVAIDTANPGGHKQDAGMGPSRKRAATIRTLDAVTIEGEIAVPQVLFITSRDYRRYRDGLGLTLRPSALDVARSLDLPARLRIVAQTGRNKEEGQ